jgi:hypothetical protein
MDMLNIKSLPRCNSIDLSAVAPSLLLLLSMPLRPLIESNPSLFFLTAVNVGAWYGGLRAGFLPGEPLQEITDPNF